MSRNVAASHSGVVPHVVAWSDETSSDQPLRMVKRFGISGFTEHVAFAGEVDSDRDEYGVLWARQPQRRTGVPLYGQVHTRRQRAAMIGLRCQVCGGPATRTPAGVLWMLPDAASAEQWEHGEAVVTGNPPVCRGCVDVAMAECPHLGSAGGRVVSVPAVRVWGVVGHVIDSGPTMVHYAYRDIGPIRPYLLATCLLVVLRHRDDPVLKRGMGRDCVLVE